MNRIRSACLVDAETGRRQRLVGDGCRHRDRQILALRGSGVVVGRGIDPRRVTFGQLVAVSGQIGELRQRRVRRYRQRTGARQRAERIGVERAFCRVRFPDGSQSLEHRGRG